MPAPPVPRVFESYHSISTVRRHSESEINSSSTNEILNPDVPEFVPTTERTNELIDTNKSNQTTTTNKFHFEKIKETLAIAEMFLLPPNNNSPIKIKEDKLLATTDSFVSDSLTERMNGESDSSSDNAWKEVTIFILYCIKLHCIN